MSYADYVVTGRVRTLNPQQPTAQAVAVSGERIAAVGTREDVEGLVGPRTRVLDVGAAAVLPGFVEAHGHPFNEALILGTTTDIRPVTVADADGVLDVVKQAVGQAGPEGVYFNGWDPLLQRGLPLPDRAWLDNLAADRPVVILHNSGHAVYFNSAAASAAGLGRQTPDPTGAHYERDHDGELTGVGVETGAVLQVLQPVLGRAPSMTSLLKDETARLNAVGVTTCSEMAWDPRQAGALHEARAAGALTARLRLYEVSTPALTSAARPGDGDDLVRQVGIKMWADGTPWIGNIATSFPYLDTPTTREMGLEPGHRGTANYTREQLDDIVEAYFPLGWQLSCHAHGDLAIDMVLDCWQDLLQRHPRQDHRLRLEHVGAMTPRQFQRAATLGVTVSIFVDHLYYWGDVLVDDLFGLDHASRWSDAGAAADAGLRISFHNDTPVTPEEPLRNLGVAATRTTRSGRALTGGGRVPVERGLRAHGSDAAWQLFSEQDIGTLEPGKYADLVVLSADPVATAAENVVDLQVLATVLAGRQVHGNVL